MHQTAFTGVAQMQEHTISPINDVLNGQPRRNLTFSARGSHGYLDRYFAEASFGYNGSECFAEKNRFGFFPACGLAWVVTSEPWMKKLERTLSYFKLRASYGKVGNDGIVEYPRFVFLPTITEMNAGHYPRANGGNNFKRTYVRYYANPDIQWEIAETMNVGADFKLFGGIIDGQIDVYRELRHNIISNRVTIPATMGLKVPPLDNIGETDSRGVDVALKYQHMFSKDCWLILNNTLTSNRVKYREIEEATDKPLYPSSR